MKKVATLVMALVLLMYPDPLMAQSAAPSQNGAVEQAASEIPTTPKPGESDAETPSDRITVDFTNADIRDVLQIMALKGKVNIVASPEVAGTVTIHLADVPWENALDTIVRTYGLTYEQEGNIVHVFSATSPEGTPKPEEIRSEVITLRYASLKQVTGALQKAFPLARVESVRNSNQILISDTPSNLKKAQKMVKFIDKRQPQVYIEAKIIRTELTRNESMGVDWTVIARAAGSKRPTTFPFAWDAAKRGPDSKLKQARLFPVGQTQTLDTTTSTATGATGTSQTNEFKNDFAFPYVKAEEFIFGTLDFSQLSAVLTLLNERRNTKTISNPRIVTANNKKASIKVGGEIGIPTFELSEQTGTFQVTGFDMRDFGITLDVVPHITEKGEILMHVIPAISSFDGFETISDTGLSSPKFSSIDAKTNVLVQSGDTLMIGGLITNNSGDERNKVPALNRIPFFGWAFKSFHRSPQGNNKSETIFFITVHIVDDVFSKKAANDWKRSEKDFEEFQKFSEEKYFPKSKRQLKKEAKQAAEFAKAKEEAALAAAEKAREEKDN